MTRRLHRRRHLLAWAPAMAVCIAATSLTAAAAATAEGAGADDLPWMDTSLAPERRADLLLDAMTLDQKLQQLTGAYPEILPDLPECYGGRHVTGIEELGIPTLRITNGPVGVGQNDCIDPAVAEDPDSPWWVAYTHPSSAKATALPSATTVAASFDPEVAAGFGDVIGTEMRNLALHVFEAPGANMARLPVLGRNFEYFGEDPYLSGTMAVSEIRAVQDKGLIGMAKHFVANEQETNRMSIDEIVDERTLHEMYLLPFEMAVKDGDVASVMCAYNYVNGVSSCENEYTLTEVLRNQWGFEGYVQSDFFAAKSTANTLLAGMDHMMPVPLQWAPEHLKAALDSGKIQISHLDTALKRRYVQMFTYGIFDRPLEQTEIDYAAGGEKARQIGTQGAVLLQNNGALPITSDVQDIVVIGKASQVYSQQAVAGGVMVGQPMGAGGGSSDVVPTYTVSPVEGIRNVLADLGNTTARVSSVLVDDKNVKATIDGAQTTFEAAMEQSRAADAVVIMAGTIAEEGADRATFSDATGRKLADLGDDLDWYADRLNSIATVDGPNAAKNSNTIAMIKAIMDASPEMPSKTTLVLKDNAGVAMDPDLVGDAGPAILEAWFPGQEDGHIVADLLFGVENPSGKSPVTYPYAGKGFLDDISARQYPGVMEGDQQTVEYSEGVDIGYRWYDSNVSGDCPTTGQTGNPCVAFPFGHGLSYSTFEISNLAVTPKVSDGTRPIKVQFLVENTGDVAGAEAPQVYLSLPASVDAPPKRLVGFDKVELRPGEKKRVEITIDPAAAHHPLSVWNSDADRWDTPIGEFTVHAGNSSQNLTLSDTFATIRVPSRVRR